MLDRVDFKYVSNVAGLLALCNLVFDLIEPSEDVQILSINIAQA